MPFPVNALGWEPAGGFGIHLWSSVAIGGRCLPPRIGGVRSAPDMLVPRQGPSRRIGIALG